MRAKRRPKLANPTLDAARDIANDSTADVEAVLRPRPRGLTKRELDERLNRLCLVLNAAFAEISEIRQKAGREPVVARPPASPFIRAFTEAERRERDATIGRAPWADGE